jgi:hypothetical protein
VVGAAPNISCAHAIHIANTGDHVDGDDNARYRYLNREWQCVVVARPDQGQETELGCFTPKAFVGEDYVTFLIHSAGD